MNAEGKRRAMLPMSAFDSEDKTTNNGTTKEDVSELVSVSNLLYQNENQFGISLLWEFYAFTYGFLTSGYTL